MSTRRLESIVVGPRRREDFGDLDGLAASIERFGLLHPIVIDDCNNLIAGERRYRACRQLGWAEVDVRPLGELSEAERREIELEENLRRKDLTPYEQSRTLVRLVETAREVVAEQASDNFAHDGQKSRGRPSQHGAPLAAVADRVGVPRATIQRAEQHVAAVERYPELKPAPAQTEAIQAAKVLDTVSDDVREEVRREVRQGVTSIREVPRRAVQAERAKGRELMGIAVEATGGQDAMRLAQIGEQFMMVMKRAAPLQFLKPDEVAMAIEPEDTQAVARFIRETGDWLKALESALNRPLRAVK